MELCNAVWEGYSLILIANFLFISSTKHLPLLSFDNGERLVTVNEDLIRILRR